MSEGLKKTRDFELDNDLALISEIPERVKKISDITRLKELLVRLSTLKLSILDTINWRLSVQPNNTFEFAALNTQVGSFTYYDYLALEKIINSHILEIQKKSAVENSISNSWPFENNESKNFITYLVEKWIKEEPNKKTAIDYIFWQIWYKSEISECTYRVISTSTQFAKFWNQNYKEVFKLDEKNPKFKKEITNKRYKTKFDQLLYSYNSNLETGD